MQLISLVTKHELLLLLQFKMSALKRSLILSTSAQPWYNHSGDLFHLSYLIRPLLMVCAHLYIHLVTFIVISIAVSQFHTTYKMYCTLQLYGNVQTLLLLPYIIQCAKSLKREMMYYVSQMTLVRMGLWNGRDNSI